MQRLPTVVFLHGFLGQPEDWNETIKFLESQRQYTVRSLDLWTDFDLPTLQDLDDWLNAFARDYRADAPLLLCGYSLGARLAMLIACKWPDLVEGLVVISGHPGLKTEKEKKMRYLQDVSWGETFRKCEWSEAIRRWNEQAVFGGNRRQPKPIAPHFVQAALQLFSLGRQPDLRGCLSKLQKPILWITGADDEKFCALADEDWLKEAGITVWQIPGCGHRVPFEKPQELAALLAPFFDQFERSDEAGRVS